MKVVVVVLSLVTMCSVSGITDDDSLDQATCVEDCADELGITSEELKKWSQNIENFVDFVDDIRAQNFFKCFYQKLGYIDQNGDFQESVVIQRWTTGDEHRITEDDVKQCTKGAGDNKANSFAIKLHVCYVDAFGKATDDSYLFRKNMQVCANEVEITSETAKKYRSPTTAFVDDPKAQDLHKCLLQKIGLIDQNGDFQESVAIEMGKEGVVKECIAIAGDKKASTFAIKFIKCADN